MTNSCTAKQYFVLVGRIKTEWKYSGCGFLHEVPITESWASAKTFDNNEVLKILVNSMVIVYSQRHIRVLHLFTSTCIYVQWRRVSNSMCRDVITFRTVHRHCSVVAHVAAFVLVAAYWNAIGFYSQVESPYRPNQRTDLRVFPRPHHDTW